MSPILIFRTILATPRLAIPVGSVIRCTHAVDVANSFNHQFVAVNMVPVQVWAANDRFLLGALMQGDADLVTTKDLEQG